MKTTYRILVIVLLTFSFSCKNTSSEQKVTTNQNPMNDELTNTRNYEEDGNLKEDVYTFERKTDSINENWNLDSPVRQERLYTRFNMSESQQEQYKKALKDWWASDIDNPYDKISTKKRIKAESDILKNILDDNQYDRYKVWFDDNDKR